MKSNEAREGVKPGYEQDPGFYRFFQRFSYSWFLPPGISAYRCRIILQPQRLPWSLSISASCLSKGSGERRIKMIDFLFDAAEVVLDVIINIFSAKRRKLKAQRKAEETGGTSEHTEDEQGQ